MSAEHKGFLQTFREALSHAVLVESPGSGAGTRVFRLRRPGRGGVGGVDLAFIGADFKRTVITTDYGLGINGVVSVHGIGVDELLAETSADELAAWFLERQWSRERAAEGLEELIGRRKVVDDDVESGERLEATLDSLYEAWMDEEAFRSALIEDGVAADEVPGYGYDPRDQALLQAIVERFAELVADGLASQGDIADEGAGSTTASVRG